MKDTYVELVFEEAHLHTSQQKMRRYDLGEPMIVRLLRTGRKFSLSCLVIDQTPSELPPALLGNLASRIVFRLSNYPCVRAISRTMGLSGGQEEELVELARRFAIVQTADTPRPFIIRVVDIAERYRPPEDELLARERESLALLDYEIPAVDVVGVLLGGRKKDERLELKPIRGDMLKVLTRICEVPAELIEERSEEIGIERSREGRARENLNKLGTIEMGDKVGSKWHLYVATEKGKRWARSMGLKVAEFKSGVGHEFMVRRVRESLERFFADIEFFSAGESLGIIGVQPDLLAGMRLQGPDTGWRMAIQVSSTNKSAYEVDKAIELAGIPQIDVVVVVAKNKTSRKSIEMRLGERTGSEGLLWRERGERKDAQNKTGKGPREEHHKETRRGGRIQGDAHVRECAKCIKIIDFEMCVSRDYDWSWVIK